MKHGKLKKYFGAVPIAALLLILLAAGCGGGRPSNTVSPAVSGIDAETVSKISGSVQSSSGGLARTADAAVASVAVTLYDNGKKIAETTTNASGAFTLQLSGEVVLTSLLKLSANNGTSVMRAFVTSSSVTINPGSELVFNKVQSSGKPLSAFSIAELKSMHDTAVESYSSSCASSTTVSGCETALLAAIGSSLDTSISSAAGEVVASAYAGTAACSKCHQEIAAKFEKSGHPYKLRTKTEVLQDIAEGKTPDIPIENFAGSPILGSWDNVSYVIGGYKWKARVVDNNGYIYTGTDAQYNLANDTQTGYNASTPVGTLKYNCGACHTTGWTAGDGSASTLTDNQDGLPGMDGTFVDGGVQCEACHGPGANHVNTRSNMVVDDSAELCGSCHNRTTTPKTLANGTPLSIPAKDGYIEHHEQWNEMMAGPHNNMKCVSCHDPHSKASEGITRTCENCHAQIATNLSQAKYMSGVDCIDCHMSEATKSAVGDSVLKKGDVKTHIFSISTDPDYSFFTTDGKYVALDSNSQAKLSLTIACTKCHSTLNADFFADSLLGSTFSGGTGWDHKTLKVTNNQNPAVAASYVGSSTCSNCHTSVYSNFIKSGHPYKLRSAAQTQADIASGLTPSIPIENFAGAPILGSWDNVSYVIGGFKWKARMVDSNGYIYTAADAQYNLEQGAQTGYNSTTPAGTLPYTCGACHTTGWVADSDATTDGDLSDNQDGLEGIYGTWELPGIQCEACHGPGSNHVNYGTDLPSDTSKEACGSCHYRTVNPTNIAAGTANLIPAKSGYIEHHEQYNEMVASPHDELTCVTCHDPHKKADSSGGIKVTCESCHKTQDANLALNAEMSSLACGDCHMADVGKSGYSQGTYQGDVMSHMFAISTDDTYSSIGSTSVNLVSGKGYVDLNFACERCHSGKTKSEFKASLLGAAGTGTWDHKTMYDWTGQ